MVTSERPRIIGLLGGGQLGRMLIDAANRHNIQVNVLDGENSPAKQISNHDGHITGSFTDESLILKLEKACDVLTIEIEHVNVAVLEEISRTNTNKVQPHPTTIKTIQNKFVQKNHLCLNEIPVATYREVIKHEKEHLVTIGEDLEYPFMLKSQTQAYDGRGNYPIKGKHDIPGALTALKDRPLYAEKWAEFKKELAVMVVKSKDSVIPYPTVETIHQDSICKLVYAPAPGVSQQVLRQAQELACKAVSTFKGKGVFGVEMFLLEDDTLLVNEIAPRPHNSGHYTIESCPMSQYEAHLRAILDLPIPQGSMRLREPAIMLNILGGADTDSHLRVEEAALDIPNCSVHLYGKGDARPGRKMGHVTITAPSLHAAETAMQPLIALLDSIRAQRPDVAAPEAPSFFSASIMPPVAVVMGSKTDLPTLKPGLALLRDLGIPLTVRVTSAHRTPQWMAEFASAAAGNGVKVIIAAAGGAAHLPGMAAAHTPLPVIGVPVKPSVGDGTDSLLSIVAMPRGVPVATVGINNAVNAALLAARILGVADEEVRAAVVRYAERAAKAAAETDAELVERGWEAVVAELEGK